MAELDWRIPLSGEAPKINTPFENLDIVLRSKANQQKVQSNALELRQQTQDAEDRDAIRSIAQQYGNDPETMLQKITERNPVLGMKMRGEMQDLTIKNLNVDITKRKLHADKIDEHLTGLLSVRKGDDVAWQRARAATMQEDQTVGSELPEHLLTDEDVTQRNAVAMKGMTARTMILADLQEQHRVQAEALAARKADEQERHARETEANAGRSANRMEAAQLATAGYQAQMANAADRRAAAAENNQPLEKIIGPDGEAVYAPRSQAVGQKVPKSATGTDGKLSATAIDKIAGADTALNSAKRISELVPKYTPLLGPIAGRVAQGRQNLPGADEGYAEFAAEVNTLSNSVIKAITGAQMSEPESRRIMSQVPQLTNQPEVFRARLKSTVGNLETLKKRTIELSGGTAPAPSGQATTAPDLSGLRPGMKRKFANGQEWTVDANGTPRQVK